MATKIKPTETVTREIPGDVFGWRRDLIVEINRHGIMLRAKRCRHNYHMRWADFLARFDDLRKDLK